MPIILSTITIEGKTYALKEIEPPEGRRLIIALVRYVEGDESDADGSLIVARSKAFKWAFAKSFPNAEPFIETTRVFTVSSEWVYVLPNAQQTHIDWANKARECGMIDTYIVDYGRVETRR